MLHEDGFRAGRFLFIARIAAVYHLIYYKWGKFRCTQCSFRLYEAEESLWLNVCYMKWTTNMSSIEIYAQKNYCFIRILWRNLKIVWITTIIYAFKRERTLVEIALVKITCINRYFELEFQTEIFHEGFNERIHKNELLWKNNGRLKFWYDIFK